jgi:hypothetical protein
MAKADTKARGGKKKDDDEGRELHREFVGMLFALAIGQVALDAANLTSGSVSAPNSLPSYSHLILAALVIATSWVGWGQSDHSLSDIEDVFSFDFVELLIDLWLVVLYFLLVMGTELPQGAGDKSKITPDALNESKWIFVIFVSYFVWDVISKIAPPKKRKELDPGSKATYSWFPLNDKGHYIVLQRAWASLACMGLAYLAYAYSSRVGTSISNALLADIALVSLVFLFRSLKLRNLYDLPFDIRAVCLSILLLIGFLVFLAGATQFTYAGDAISRGASSIIRTTFGEGATPPG